jgi:hypothetical protein
LKLALATLRSAAVKFLPCYGTFYGLLALACCTALLPSVSGSRLVSFIAHY